MEYKYGKTFILTATVKSGKQIDCKVQFNQFNYAKTQYPVENKDNGWCLRLTKKQVKDLLAMSVAHDRNFVKLDKQYKYDEYDKMMDELRGIKDPTIAELLKENKEFSLRRIYYTCGDKGIVGLPKVLKEKESLLGKVIDFDWNVEEERFEKTITMKNLMELIKKAESDKQQQKSATKKKIAELTQQAQKTGQPQKYYSYSNECNDPEADCDIDNIIVYINQDGTQTEERHHCY